MNFLEKAGKNKKVYEDFFNRNSGKYILNVYAYMKSRSSGVESYTLDDGWLNPECLLEKFVSKTYSTYYAGCAFPMHHMNLGSRLLAEMLGADFYLTDKKIMFGKKQLLSDKTKSSPLRFNKDSFLFTALKKISEYFIENKALVSLADFGMPVDVLETLRTTEDLKTDIVCDYNFVAETLNKISDYQSAAFSENCKILANQNGYTSYIPLFSEKPYIVIKNEASAAFSKELFLKLILPSVMKAAIRADRAVYAISSLEELKFLDIILSISKINAVAFYQNFEDGFIDLSSPAYMAAFKKIQSAKKGLIISSVYPDDVQGLVENLNHNALMIETRCQSKKDADQLLNDLKY